MAAQPRPNRPPASSSRRSSPAPPRSGWRPGQRVFKVAHSITSPRIRNLAALTVMTEIKDGDDQPRPRKRDIAIAHADDQKQQHRIEMRHMVSSPSTRSQARAPATCASRPAPARDQRDLRAGGSETKDVGAHSKSPSRGLVAVTDQALPVGIAAQVRTCSKGGRPAAHIPAGRCRGCHSG